MHLGWVVAIHALLALFVFFVLVDPLGPVGLNLRVSGLLLGESWPVFAFRVLLDDVEQDVSALDVPGAGFLVNLLVEVEVESV